MPVKKDIQIKKWQRERRRVDPCVKPSRRGLLKTEKGRQKEAKKKITRQGLTKTRKRVEGSVGGRTTAKGCVEGRIQGRKEQVRSQVKWKEKQRQMNVDRLRKDELAIKISLAQLGFPHTWKREIHIFKWACQLFCQQDYKGYLNVNFSFFLFLYIFVFFPAYGVRFVSNCVKLCLVKRFRGQGDLIHGFAQLNGSF